MNIPDILEKKSMTVNELAKACNCKNSITLSRFLRTAQAYGYFHEDIESGLWSNSKYSQILTSNHPNSLKSAVLYWKEEVYEVLGNLSHLIRDDVDIFNKVHGKSIYKYLEEDPRTEELFGGFMKELNSLDWYSQCEDLNWGSFDRIVDIGGSFGTLLAHILRSYPRLTGHLFDRPPVITKARKIWNEMYQDLLTRVVMSSGTYFLVGTLPILKDGDCIILRQVLQDCDDDKALLLLYNLRTAIGSRIVTVCIIEMTATPNDPVSMRHLMDLHLRIVANGIVRRAPVVEAMFAQTGFKMVKIVETRTLFRIMVAMPL